MSVAVRRCRRMSPLRLRRTRLRQWRHSTRRWAALAALLRTSKPSLLWRRRRRSPLTSRDRSRRRAVCANVASVAKWLRTHMWNEHKTIPEMFDVLNAASTAALQATVPPDGGHEAPCGREVDDVEPKIEPAAMESENAKQTTPEPASDAHVTLMSEVDEDDLLNTSCDFCGETFQTLTDLQLHVFAQHANESTSSLHRRQRSQHAGGLRKASAIESVIASIVAAQSSLSRNFADVQRAARRWCSRRSADCRR